MYSAVVYKNEYNDKGLLTKKTTEYYPLGEPALGKELSETIYKYDSRDSLIEKSDYSINEKGMREISSIYTYTDSTGKEINYWEYPNDTLTYKEWKEKDNGLFREEYAFSSFKLLNGEQEKRRRKLYRTYDKEKRLIHEIENDMLSQENTERAYTYTIEQKGDTLITLLSINGKPISSKKEYGISSDAGIGIQEEFETGSIDSLFYENGNVVKEIFYYDDNKLISTIQYDEYGNETRFERESWHRDH